MNICPQCGTPNRPEARFCRQCRSAMAPTAAPQCPDCGATLRAGARFCQQCGKPVTGVAAVTARRSTCPHCDAPVRDTARFCPQCRTPLTTQAKPVPDADSRCPQCGAPTRSGARFCHMCSHLLVTTPAPAPIVSPSRRPDRFGTGSLLPLTALAGRYVILEKIAQGGMGAVYKAQDRRLQGKIVAVKEMSESAIRHTERKRVVECFQREAELLARLEHPNLVRVSDLFQEEERHYMVMEFIEGEPLEKMLEGRSQPFPEEQVLAWAEQLCEVLAYLHGQDPKIIYRDVKPANVMIVEDTDAVKLIDFGIARFFKAGKRKDTIEFGTDGYAPPEQYGKAQTDERADVYALGAMLHQLLTLREPSALLFQFPDVRDLNPQASEHVAAAVAKAVEPAKDRRHQSIQEMETALLGEESARREIIAEKRKKRQQGKAKPGSPTQPSVKSPPSGKLVPNPASMEFGSVAVGGSSPGQGLRVSFPAGEKVSLHTDAPWLHVNPRSITKSSEQIAVMLNTRRLKAGRLALRGSWLKRWIGWHARFFVPAEREALAHVELESESGHEERVPVSVTVAPRKHRRRIGWAVTVGVLLLEFAFVVGLLTVVALLLLAYLW